MKRAMVAIAGVLLFGSQAMALPDITTPVPTRIRLVCPSPPRYFGDPGYPRVIRALYRTVAACRADHKALVDRATANREVYRKQANGFAKFYVEFNTAIQCGCQVVY